MLYNFKTQVVKTLSDTHTPVGLYLKIRDKYSNSFLLESSDYKSKENSYSYICFDSIASFIVDNEQTTTSFPDKSTNIQATNSIIVCDKLNAFVKMFSATELNLGFETIGLFGYTSYDAIPLFENISFNNKTFDLPLIQYHLFKYMIVFNHFNNELFYIEQLQENEVSQLDIIQDIVNNRSVSKYKFSLVSEETSNFTDEDFLKTIKKGQDHCFSGDVFQIVLSRKYKQSFNGDEFNVYRALRSINPSPYLFYFDYGNFKIFGSSPEAQLTIKNEKAVINPIAGTFKRTGNEAEDLALAKLLLQDPKENAEHIMLVDLARNDLSKSSKKVVVESFKKIEYYSHVIHMVSKVSAQLEPNYNSIEILGNTYPAGTLSGAPKHKAMQLIDKYEPESRGFYGGTVGIIGLNGTFNHAIFIRSFLSRNNQLMYQAGCGIVIKSDINSESTEVQTKLSALRNAIQLAQNI
ncbi:anthranilate synthase component I family protein [Flavobacterium sp.]|uniref:anthranilate synthase component I family protein n=1 Tax=Flavobacterium sp. TaxID=239 RepID=UPI003752CB1D